VPSAGKIPAVKRLAALAAASGQEQRGGECGEPFHSGDLPG